MSAQDNLFHSRELAAGTTGELLSLPRERARWGWMSFFVNRLGPGQSCNIRMESEEAALPG